MTPTASSLIDLIVTTRKDLVTSSAAVPLGLSDPKLSATSSSSKVKHITNKQESKKAVRVNKYLFMGSISLNRIGYTSVLECQDSFHLAGTCTNCKQEK